MVVLAVCSAFTMAVLAVGILGSDTTGLEGDWLLGNVVLGGEIYLATVGLAAVSLRNQRGTHSYRLLQLCGEAGGVDSVWCRLDTAGADAETMLTLAFVPATGVLGLSLLTMLHNWCVVGNQGHRPEAPGGPTGCFSVVHRFVMLVLWLAFWAMTTSGLCIYAYQAPPTLGIGSVTSGKSYRLVRAAVFYASIGSVVLLARSFSLWDTQTAQSFLRDMLEARFLKQYVYWLLVMQVALYLLVSLTVLDYAMIVPLLGLNYLANKSPQTLWGYVLLTLVTLPQDAEQLAKLSQWSQMDVVERTSSASFVSIVCLKGFTLLGMLVLHTKINFRMQFFAVANDAAEEL